MRFRGISGLVSVAVLLVVGLPAAGATVPLPRNDNFYKYSGSDASLAAMKPGTVLKTRTFTFAPGGVPTPYTGVQLLYRTTTQLGKPTVTVTSVIKALTPTNRLISDQWFYDALDDKCDPSYYLANNGRSGGGTNMIEGPKIATLLAAGYNVMTSDYEGTDLAWTAGPQSGMQTLDGIRAALNSPDAGLPADTLVGLLGYSGGAIAGEWAAELAAKYAPEVSRRIVGTAIGGIYVYPEHNLRYVDGSPKWSGVAPGALLGVSRGFKLNLDTYASSLGKKLYTEAKGACIDELLGKHPGLKFAQLVKPQYANFAKVPAFVKLNNALIMSSGGTPRAPLYMGQGLDTTGQEMTDNTKPGIGPGDGVMIAGDTRELARTYCARGVSVNYDTYPAAGHTAALAPFLTNAVAFLAARFAGAPTTPNCATLPPGNSLAPLPTPSSGTPAAGTHTRVATPRHATTAPTAVQPAPGAQAVAATGPAQTERLLLWSALLLSLGTGVLWAGRRPRPAPAVARRPMPYPRS